MLVASKAPATQPRPEQEERGEEDMLCGWLTRSLHLLKSTGPSLTAQIMTSPGCATWAISWSIVLQLPMMQLGQQQEGSLARIATADQGVHCPSHVSSDIAKRAEGTEPWEPHLEGSPALLTHSSCQLLHEKAVSYSKQYATTPVVANQKHHHVTTIACRSGNSRR